MSSINVIERAVLLCETGVVDLVDLPEEIAGAVAPNLLAAIEGPTSEDLEAWVEKPVDVGRLAVVAAFERCYFSRLLDRNLGNIRETAEHAGVDPRALYNKMQKLGLRKADFKS